MAGWGGGETLARSSQRRATGGATGAAGGAAAAVGSWCVKRPVVELSLYTRTSPTAFSRSAIFVPNKDAGNTSVVCALSASVQDS